MNEENLLLELRRISCLDNLRCLGCGYEHSCSIHGCAIINEAVQRLETLTKSKANDPLSLEELLEMDGEPVWVVFNDYPLGCWALVRLWSEPPHNIFLTFKSCVEYFADDMMRNGVKIYRQKPEEKSL